MQKQQQVSPVWMKKTDLSEIQILTGSPKEAYRHPNKETKIMLGTQFSSCCDTFLASTQERTRPTDFSKLHCAARFESRRNHCQSRCGVVRRSLKTRPCRPAAMPDPLSRTRGPRPNTAAGALRPRAQRIA